MFHFPSVHRRNTHLITVQCRRRKMKPNGRKRFQSRSVPYYGQRPHLQGKSPHPLLCFSWNLRNAFKRAFPGFQECKKKKKEKSRIECLMDLFTFDINQLIIYENRNKKNKKECVIRTLRTMKMKVAEVKCFAVGSKCLGKAEVMLKQRDRLKCVSRSFRRQLIEHMANYDPSERSSRIMCKIMKELDGLDTDICSLFKCVKYKPEEEPYAESWNRNGSVLVKESRRSEKTEEDVKAKIPAICEEVMKPYDPFSDEDDKSIHLRYIPELDSFKADMARNPHALRLPLMCPAMKRIMNQMKPAYLMDDVPCKLDDSSSSDTANDIQNLTVNLVQCGRHLEGCRLPEDFKAFSLGVGDLLKYRGTEFNLLHEPKGTKGNPNFWLVASKQLWQIHS